MGKEKKMREVGDGNEFPVCLRFIVSVTHLRADETR